jgi:glycosyltransferase involved in cell wall biosynthesis
VKILLVDSGIPYTLDTPYIQPLGGSETSLLLIAKGLAELNHQVVLLTTDTTIKEIKTNLIRDNINYFNQYAELSDSIICSRNVPYDVMNFIGTKKIYYYSHDAYDQQNVQWMLNQDSLNMLTKIFCVSDWQKNTFIKYFNGTNDKLKVIGNPIDLSLYNGFTDRDPHRFIFASIPYKGENLGSLFNDICIQSKKDLSLHVYSSFAMYNNVNEDKNYEDMFRELSNIKNVYIHKSISMKELAYEFSKSSYVLFPNTYHETFNMTCVQAQAAGCIPISTDCGCMNERIVDGSNGILTEGKNILNNSTYHEFIDKTCTILNLDERLTYKMRLNCQKTSVDYDYLKISQKIINELELE